MSTDGIVSDFTSILYIRTIKKRHRLVKPPNPMIGYVFYCTQYHNIWDFNEKCIFFWIILDNAF